MFEVPGTARRDQDCADRPVSVLYIGGEGRSGSTVLSTILGGYEGVISIGEFRILWQALKDDELCGCGETVSRCPFWTSVGDRALGGWASVDLDAMLASDYRFVRHSSIPRVVVGRARHRGTELARYRAVLGNLYAAIRDVSGARVIVDSTKRASYAYLLRQVPGLDLRLIHLVRDSRGVAFSNSKSGIRRPEVTGERVHSSFYMRSQPLWRTAVDWEVKNLLFYTLVSPSKRLLVKYEDMMAEPDTVLKRIRELMGTEPFDAGTWDETSRSFESRPYHTIGGNPVRFMHGRIRLELDETWRTRMSVLQQLEVGAISFPLLLLYGYMTSG